MNRTSELVEGISKARLHGWPLYESAELDSLLRLVALTFPGMSVLGLRPVRRWFHVTNTYLEASALTFRWDRARLLSHGLLQPDDCPVAPKRLAWKHWDPDRGLVLEVRCAPKGQFTVRIDVTDDIAKSTPLAIFRPSAIRQGVRGERRDSCLRLMVDNTRAPTRGEATS